MAAIWAWIEWLKNGVVGAWDWINGFISNPYPYIANTINWVYNLAVNYTNVVKNEITNWAYGLVMWLWDWIQWLRNTYNNVIIPAINNFNGWLVNLGVQIYNSVRSVVDPILAGVWLHIHSIIQGFNILSANVGQIWNYVSNWITNQLATIISHMAQLRAQLSNIDLSYIIRELGDLKRYVLDLDIIMTRTIIDHLLDWLEHVLAEAMER